MLQINCTLLKQHTSDVVISLLMAASNNSCSSKEEKSQIKQIASAPTHNLTLGFAITVISWSM